MRQNDSHIRWLWRDYLSRHKGKIALAFIFMVIEGSMLAVLSRLIQPMFDQVFLEGSQTALIWVGATIMTVFFIRAVSSAAQKITMTNVIQRSARDMRSDLLRHLLYLDSSYHQTHPPGQLIERVQSDVQVINRSWAALLVGVGRDLIAVVALFSVALSIDWAWTLIALIGIPFMIAPSLLAQRYVRKRAARARLLAGRMATRLDEAFHGVNPIKLNALEDYQGDQFDALSDQRVKAEVRAVTGQAMVPALIDIMTGIGFLGVMIYGGGEIISGEKTVGEFMAFFTAMSLTFEPLRRLGQMSGTWQMAAASMDRVREIFNVAPTLVSPSDPIALPDGQPNLVLSDVELQYDELPVLRGLSFEAEAGKTTALVGASGAGKSTIFNVLTRLIDPHSGSVTVNGADITSLDIGALRGLYSVVTQDAALFDDTIRENILLGREDVPSETLARVMDAAHITDFVEKLPNDLDSEAGPRGSNLSGGQRQRVAIARALLRETPILLLDEATSALDTKSEAIVQEALETLSKGRTTLVIAHRLSTVRNADKIVVMDRGKVVDEGTHEALLERGGIYADLYRMQFSEDAHA
ncbi:ATP-binding cassette, subfamily B, MsbA [Cognatiyoonia sediminum]|uniref:ATP-binding cassette, subfamily B, MsbA n=1 Tax=Cognatiyoonia sediminum TaxID=1508389 RepID=A0A1M5KZL5_9RHOB|nr:ABC transporter ATP-binding protein [Cognatiyoonia sediminum]SHG58312.1 ATP-binding cassette, subfamily B, MsbA [Cognatiyoonia sediminum]